jgi:predicted unusual protein kinase regulating ubiquinone biosynthesis (AarF/ABC1/UbiB family)
VARALGDLKGPFAKAGQFASLRYDVLAPDVRAAFATLQDRVAPRPLAEVTAVVESELGVPLAARFAEFEAAARHRVGRRRCTARNSSAAKRSP